MNPLRANHPLLVPAMILIAVATILTACSPAPPGGPSDECGLIEPTQKDIDKVLSFGGDTFTSDKWIRSYTVEPYKMSLFRQNDGEGAIAYIEYLIYTCGYGQAELDEYFSEEGFDIAFNAYEVHTLTAFCEQGSLALYKFDLTDEGTQYTSHYWVEQTDDSRVLAVMLVFPAAGAAQLDRYSQKLFPALSSCQ